MSNSTQLTFHNRIRHSKQKRFTCAQCRKTFTRSSSLRVHTGEQSYRCHFGQKEFALLNHLINPIRVHTGEKPYQCGSCQMKFRNSASLNYHNTRVHT